MTKENALKLILADMQELAIIKKYRFVEGVNDKLKIGFSDYQAYNIIKEALEE